MSAKQVRGAGSSPGYRGCFDPAPCVEDMLKVAVHVNGKLRGTETMARDTADDGVKAAVLANERIATQVTGKEIRKVIFVKNRLMNLTRSRGPSAEWNVGLL